MILPRTGRRQPLAALYHRALADHFAAALKEGERKLGKVIDAVPHAFVDFPDDALFFNVNTAADWRLACGRLVNEQRPTPLVTISAPVSNTGKTTFIERVLPKLSEMGIRTGVVKGDCHGYDVDEEGKDSWRFKQLVLRASPSSRRTATSSNSGLRRGRTSSRLPRGSPMSTSC